MTITTNKKPMKRTLLYLEVDQVTQIDRIAKDRNKLLGVEYWDRSKIVREILSVSLNSLMSKKE